MANPAVTVNRVGTGQPGTQMLSSIFSKYGIFLIFIVMVVAASILSPAFLSPINLINIVRQMSVVGLIALGVTGVIVSAGIDLSSGSVEPYSLGYEIVHAFGRLGPENARIAGDELMSSYSWVKQ